jgi:hypothetical protein
VKHGAAAIARMRQDLRVGLRLLAWQEFLSDMMHKMRRGEQSVPGDQAVADGAAAGRH